jgi:catechol 2,3-dioxygenase-like lactoylglutathione lyase family enzyme
MESAISDLVARFEKGGLTRRELVRGLAMLAGASVAVSAAQGADFKGATIDHVSIQVADLERSTAFYQKMFGFTVVSEDKPHGIVRLGFTKPIVSINHEAPAGIVDHFALGLPTFDRDAMTAYLKEHGATPQNDPFAGFHIKDPDGVNIQIVQG